MWSVGLKRDNIAKCNNIMMVCIIPSQNQHAAVESTCIILLRLQYYHPVHFDARVVPQPSERHRMASLNADRENVVPLQVNEIEQSIIAFQLVHY